MESADEQWRPARGLTLPIKVMGVKDAARLLVTFPGSIPLELILLGIEIEDTYVKTEWGYRLIPAAREAAGITARLLSESQRPVAYLPQPPFDKGWIRNFNRPDAKFGAVVFLTPSLTLQAALVEHGAATVKEDSHWLNPPANWATFAFPGEGSDPQPRRSARAARLAT